MSSSVDDITVVETPKDTSSAAGRSGPSLLSVLAIAASVVALVFGVLGMVLPSKGGAAATQVTMPASINTTPQVFDIELGDIYVKPNKLDVAPNQVVVLRLHNVGAMEHDLKLNGTTGSKMLKPGETEEINIGAVTNGAQAWCTVPGHKEAGMVLTFNVAGGEPAGAAAAPGVAADPYAGSATWDPQAAPGPDWKPYDPELKPAATGTTHDIAMSMTEKVMEVAPGVTQEMWTFDDMVPGPTLRGKVGDVFNVTVTNNGKMAHSIDFHASQVAPNRLMKNLQPGESIVYQFKAEYSGIWMYHCATAPALHHIGNGMSGAVVIDPPNLAPVEKEFIFVQGELYFGPEGQPGNLTKMQNDDWDAIMFNGYASQYVHAPIKAEAGKRYRAWVVDNGPSENSSFHIVGTIFDTVFKEGNYLLKPGNENHGGSQALDLQPAQGGFVEWTFAEDGIYTMVTHKFSNVGKGGAGLFQVGNVEIPGAGGGH